MKRVKITGARGDWTALVEQHRLAVIHNCWMTWPSKYHDPMVGAKTDGKRYADFLAALCGSDRVVMQKDIPGSFTRDGYLGVFTYKDLMIGDDGSVSLTIMARVMEAAR